MRHKAAAHSLLRLPPLQQKQEAKGVTRSLPWCAPGRQSRGRGPARHTASHPRRQIAPAHPTAPPAPPSAAAASSCLRACRGEGQQSGSGLEGWLAAVQGAAGAYRQSAAANASRPGIASHRRPQAFCAQQLSGASPHVQKQVATHQLAAHAGGSCMRQEQRTRAGGPQQRGDGARLHGHVHAIHRLEHASPRLEVLDHVFHRHLRAVHAYRRL